jgi:tyrosine-protein kinase Etk/Wzc
LKSETVEQKQETGKEFEINLLDVAIVLARHIKLLVALPFIMAVIALIVVIQSPDIYTADTTFMPPTQSASASSMLSSLGSLGSLSGLLGGGGGVGGMSSGPKYIAVIKSRALRDDMVKRFKLLDVYHTKSLESARNALAGQTVVKTGKDDGLITIKITDTNPKRAALLANGYVEVLLKKNKELALSEASQTRLAAEQEFLKAKNTLGDAEIEIKKLQEKTGLITVGSQIAMLQSMINSTERQLAEMSLSATSNNPEYIKTRQKLNNLQTEIGKAQAGSNYVSKAPERILDFTRKTRNLKYAEALYQLALQQLTLARIDESKASSSIQVIDRAVVPEQKAGPLLSRIVLFTALAGLFIAVIIAFIIEAYQRSTTNQESAAQLQTLKSYLRWK